jgi:hypothetical protein
MGCSCIVLIAKLAIGDALITVATGALSEAESEQLGLVPTHAYAVLSENMTLDQVVVWLH